MHIIFIDGFQPELGTCERSKSGTHLGCSPDNCTWAVGAVVARFLDTEEVTGSNPVSPTNECSPDKAKPWASQIQQMILTPETGRQPREAREVGWYNAARR